MKEKERIKNGTPVYNICTNVKCIECDNIGAFQYIGNVIEGKLFHTIGFGDTIPYECAKCGSTGLVGVEGLENSEKAFNIVN